MFCFCIVFGVRCWQHVPDQQRSFAAPQPFRSGTAITAIPIGEHRRLPFKVDASQLGGTPLPTLTHELAHLYDESHRRVTLRCRRYQCTLLCDAGASSNARCANLHKLHKLKPISSSYAITWAVVRFMSPRTVRLPLLVYDRDNQMNAVCCFAQRPGGIKGWDSAVRIFDSTRGFPGERCRDSVVVSSA